MNKRILLTCFIMAFFPIVSFAVAYHPVVTFSLGVDRTKVLSTKKIILIPPFQNSYIGNNHYDTQPLVGLFFGAEMLFPQNWEWQLGLSYFQSASFAENGIVSQFSDPDFNNLSYEYQIQSRRFSVETKLSRAYQQKWHPYVSASIGKAFNKAYAYTETPITSDAVPMAQPFAGHKTTQLTYSAGFGIDVDLGEHVRGGVGYRFLDLGNASLGVTPLQSSTNTISNTHLYTNEFLVQLSFIG